VIQAAQAVGLSLDEIKRSLDDLPESRTPNASDWGRLSSAWRDRLDARIEALERLRDELSDCIGCGCLSLWSCGILNPGDAAARKGPGARYLLGDTRQVVSSNDGPSTVAATAATTDS
jgi:MerR family redox-sensitive transcriptional activator SoxR